MHTDAKDWQIRQHHHFSHHNYMHRSLTPRTLREAFGQETVLTESGHRQADTLVMLVVCSIFAALILNVVA